MYITTAVNLNKKKTQYAQTEEKRETFVLFKNDASITTCMRKS